MNDALQGYMLGGYSAEKRLQGRTWCAGAAATSDSRVDGVKNARPGVCEASLSAFTKLDPCVLPAARAQACQLGRLAPSLGEVVQPLAGAADLGTGVAWGVLTGGAYKFARNVGRGRVRR